MSVIRYAASAPQFHASSELDSCQVAAAGVRGTARGGGARARPSPHLTAREIARERAPRPAPPRGPGLCVSARDADAHTVWACRYGPQPLAYNTLRNHLKENTESSTLPRRVALLVLHLASIAPGAGPPGRPPGWRWRCGRVGSSRELSVSTRTQECTVQSSGCARSRPLVQTCARCPTRSNSSGHGMTALTTPVSLWAAHRAHVIPHCQGTRR